MAVGALLVVVVLVLQVADDVAAWKWKSFFDDDNSDSVVTVAADGRGVYPVYRTYSGYRTVILRVPAVPDFGPAVVTRVRHVYSLPPPLPPLPPPPPPSPLPPFSTRYGVPAALPPPGPAPATNSAAATAAAVATAVARTILEAHGFSRSFELADRHELSSSGGRALWTTPRDSYAPPPFDDRGARGLQDLHWQGQRGRTRADPRDLAWRR